MSDEHLDDPAAAPPGAGASAHDDIGSVGEEALKLFGAFADLARQHGGDAAGAFGAVAGQAAAMAHEVNEHLATDAAECRYCPICRVVHVVRETSPEVRAHLTTAASSLLQAAAGLLATLPPPPGDDGASPSPRGPAVERIDLDDAGPGPGTGPTPPTTPLADDGDPGPAPGSTP